METRNANIRGLLSPWIWNIHRCAASDDCTRRVLRGVHVDYENSTLNIVSTDGRLLLHTSVIMDCGNQPYAATFYMPYNVHGTDGDMWKFAVYGDPDEARLEVETKTGIFAYREIDGTYPRYRDTEFDWNAAKRPRCWRSFDPKYLARVMSYVGHDAYIANVRSPDGNDFSESPVMWRVSDGACTRTAVLMPFRCCVY